MLKLPAERLVVRRHSDVAASMKAKLGVAPQPPRIECG